MALATLKNRILLSNVWIAREGDTHDSGTVARASKPASSDDAWLDLGIVKDMDISTEDIKPVEILAPAGGQLVTYDEIKAGTKATLKLTISETNYLHLEHIFGTAKLEDDTAQANPLEGATKRAWLHFETCDQDVAAGGTPTVIGDVWARVKITGPVKLAGGDPAEVQLEALVLYSAYNTLAF